MSEILSYGQILKDKLNFVKSGTNSGDDFNLYDTPSTKYFKILFYFGDISSKSNIEIGQSNGLLHPTWTIFENNTTDDSRESTNILNLNYYDYNSAWSFLKRNDENERAEKLKKFIMLLSNINSYSPWYFTSISGLDAAMERKGPADEKIEIGEPGRLTITCLPDAFDNRIGTLLELYRDITWSWVQKKEIIPANLRKFDMAIYIFETPIKFWHDNDETVIGKNNLDKSNESSYKPSYKMLEFHDCEFNYNSIKSGWSELNNQTGVSPTYSIEISYNDCYEISYNEHMMRTIGDVIETDTYSVVIGDNTTMHTDLFKSKAQSDDNNQINEINNRMNAPSSSEYSFGNRFDGGKLIYSFGNLENENSERLNVSESSDNAFNGRSIPESSSFNIERNYERKSNEFTQGFIEKATGQLAAVAKSYVEHKLNRAVLGNLYTYSLTKLGTQLSELEKGNIIKTGQSIKQYIDNAQQRAAAKSKKSVNLGNLYKNTIANN